MPTVFQTDDTALLMVGWDRIEKSARKWSGLFQHMARLAVLPSPSHPIPISSRVRLPSKMGYSGHKGRGRHKLPCSAFPGGSHLKCHSERRVFCSAVGRPRFRACGRHRVQADFSCDTIMIDASGIRVYLESPWRGWWLGGCDCRSRWHFQHKRRETNSILVTHLNMRMASIKVPRPCRKFALRRNMGRETQKFVIRPASL